VEEEGKCLEEGWNGGRGDQGELRGRRSKDCGMMAGEHVYYSTGKCVI